MMIVIYLVCVTEYKMIVFSDVTYTKLFSLRQSYHKLLLIAVFVCNYSYQHQKIPGLRNQHLQLKESQPLRRLQLKARSNPII